MSKHKEMCYQSHQPGENAMVDSFRRLERLELPKTMNGYRVLDIGCNEGFFCNIAAQRGASEVIGIDKNEKRLSIARSLYGNNKVIKFFLQSWHKLPEGKFDLILWTSAMHYELNPYSVFLNIASRLKANGIFVLECGVHPDQGSEMVRVIRHDRALWYPTKNYLDAMLRRAGFSFRFVSRPEKVGLDPIPRLVYHCNLRRTNILLITGETKSGKTSLANQLSFSATQKISLDHFVSRIANAGWAHTTLEKFVKKMASNYAPGKRDWRKVYVSIDENGLTEEYIKQILLGISSCDELVVVEGFMTQLQVQTFTRLAEDFANVWEVQLRSPSAEQSKCSSTKHVKSPSIDQDTSSGLTVSNKKEIINEEK